jgi:hypothetical protein
MSQFAEILEFFEKAATVAGIGHVANGGPKRFFGYNFQEFDDACKNNPDAFPAMLLSDSPHSGLSGSYLSADESSLIFTEVVHVLLLKTIPSTTDDAYQAEYAIYDTLKPIIDQLILWMHNLAMNGQTPGMISSGYLFIDQINFNGITVQRVGPKGAAKAYGLKLIIPFRERQVYSSDNIFSTVLT